MVGAAIAGEEEQARRSDTGGSHGRPHPAGSTGRMLRRPRRAAPAGQDPGRARTACTGSIVRSCFGGGLPRDCLEERSRMPNAIPALRSEWSLAFVAATTALFLAFGKAWL